MHRNFLVMMLSLGFALHAHANDSSATLGAGGLILQKSASVSMLSEKLAISSKQIRIDYEMQNTSASPVETTVAFPLPRLNAPDLVNIEVITNKSNPDNFVDFKVSVDGKAVQTEHEVKAFMIERQDQDVTSILKETGILISPVSNNFYEALQKLSAENQKKLVDAKLLEVEKYGDDVTLTPLWDMQITYFWKQRFDPGKIVKVHHEYNPVVGRSFLGEQNFVDDNKDWCIDQGTAKSIRNLFNKIPKPADSEKYLLREQVDYVLKTGANWAGPIKSFELTLEKESADQLISLCIDGLKKVSPTQFKLVLNDFTPHKDLSMLFVRALKDGESWEN